MTPIALIGFAVTLGVGAFVFMFGLTVAGRLYQRTTNPAAPRDFLLAIIAALLAAILVQLIWMQP